MYAYSMKSWPLLAPQMLGSTENARRPRRFRPCSTASMTGGRDTALSGW